jgi:excisionase family DNA binding protein
LETKIKLYSPKDLCKILKASPRFVYTKLASGEIPARRIGDRWYCSDDALKDYFAKSKQPPTAQS